MGRYLSVDVDVDVVCAVYPRSSHLIAFVRGCASRFPRGPHLCIWQVEFLRWRVVKRWSRQILEALRFLHQQSPPVVHK